MKAKKFSFRELFIAYGIYLVLVALILLFFFLRPNIFLSPQNIINILRQVAVVGIVAAGMTCVIISGGIDLSVGSTVGLVGVLLALFISPERGWGLGIPIGLLVALLSGIMLGLGNGFVINKLKLPPIIATLGAMITLRGVAFLITDGRPIFGFPSGFDFIGQGHIWLIPVPVIIMAVVFAVTYIILTKCRIGRYIYGIGGNEEASRLSGVNVKKVKYFVYTYSGICCAIAGIVLLSRTNSGTPRAGTGYEMDIITAVVLGGVSIKGGEGRLLGVIAGVLIMGVLANGMIVVGLSAFTQQVVQGLVLIAAVAFDIYAKQSGQSGNKISDTPALDGAEKQ